MGYLAKKILGTDSQTGLDIELRIKNLNINADLEEINVEYEEVLVSPTGVEMKVLKESTYKRYNSATKQKYNELRLSQVGQGIEYMLGLDLDIYPDLEQNP